MIAMYDGRRHKALKTRNVDFYNHKVKNPRFVLIHILDENFDAMIKYANSVDTPQLTIYTHEQFRWLHESVRRCDGGMVVGGTVWLVMTEPETTLFTLKFGKSILGIVKK